MPSPSQPTRRWTQAPIPESARILEKGGIPAWLAVLLARRGVTNLESADTFLNPRAENLTSPNDLQGISAAVERIRTARERCEKIAIVGDYDVDGISATALLLAVFRVSGLEAEAILPNRLNEGYGFQGVHVERARESGCSLIVTADCGTTAVEAVEAAQVGGIDVIITDHHLPDSDPIDGAIEINPKRQRNYASPNLAGAGVALKLALAVCDEFDRSIEVGALLRVACLGTICDMVPLVGENRTIAAAGLEELGRTRSVGLKELLRRADVRLPVTASDVGFRIGPRLNAAGRMSRPDEALELLMTRDPVRAASLAEQLDEWNRSRQAAERRAFDEALDLVSGRDCLPSILVSWSDDWHPGVVGIAAGRVARKLHRPTVLFSVEGEWATGSGRSISDIHLHEFLGNWTEEYERFGGHAQAIGIKVPVQRLEGLRTLWEDKAQELWDEETLTREYRFELEMPVSGLTIDLVAQLGSLEPFGIGNQQPVLRVGPLTAKGRPRLFGKGHLGLAVEGEDGSPLDLLGWNWADRAQELVGAFEVLGCLQMDDYTKRPVLRLMDARPWKRGPESSAQDAAVPHRMTPDG